MNDEVIKFSDYKRSKGVQREKGQENKLIISCCGKTAVLNFRHFKVNLIGRLQFRCSECGEVVGYGWGKEDLDKLGLQDFYHQEKWENVTSMYGDDDFGD